MAQEKEYQKAMDFIYQQIKGGKLSIGDRLPTERAIAEQLGISRNSTREALRMLENMGIVESKRGSGNYLSGNMKENISKMVDMMLLLKQTSRDEIASFRRYMEKAVCFSLIENGIKESWLQTLKEILSKAEQAENVEEQIALDRQFHYTLIEATENQFWITFLQAITDVYRQFIEVTLKCANQSVKEELKSAHWDILYALEQKNRETCEKAIDRHYMLYRN